MTDAEIFKLGFLPVEGRQRVYYNYRIGCDLNIPDSWGAKEIIDAVYDSGFKKGYFDGDNNRMTMIQNALGLSKFKD